LADRLCAGGEGFGAGASTRVAGCALQSRVIREKGPRLCYGLPRR